MESLIESLIIVIISQHQACCVLHVPSLCPVVQILDRLAPPSRFISHGSIVLARMVHDRFTSSQVIEFDLAGLPLDRRQELRQGLITPNPFGRAIFSHHREARDLFPSQLVQ